MTVKVKICGITRLEDALCAAKAGASFLGYIFYPPSKRFVAPRTAKEIIGKVRAEFPDVEHVGVFVDEGADNVAWTVNLAGLDYAQLHGRETAGYCEELDLLGVRVIKTVGVSAKGLTCEPSSYNAAYFLFDTFDEQLKGGTGRQFDIDQLPEGLSADNVIIAGGLNTDNVGDILKRIRPFAVDVSSGVEERPGIKCHRRVKEFLDAVRLGCRAEEQNDQREARTAHVIK